MHSKFEKISDDEMKIEVTVEAPQVDAFIRKMMAELDDEARKDIQAAKELGLLDDPAYQKFIGYVADRLARKMVIKASDKNNTPCADLINFNATYEAPLQEGKPFNFQAVFPLLNSRKTKRPEKAKTQKSDRKMPGVVIYVSNVPVIRSEQEIKDVFQKAGKVLSVEFAIHSGTGERLETVMISFPDEQSAIDAYFLFEDSYIGHNRPMKIRFKDAVLQENAERGNLHGSFHGVKHYFKQGS